ncbi:hypothetical protein Gotur_033403 [Gossypium turneri]
MGNIQKATEERIMEVEVHFRVNFQVKETKHSSLPFIDDLLFKITSIFEAIFLLTRVAPSRFESFTMETTTKMNNGKKTMEKKKQRGTGIMMKRNGGDDDDKFKIIC